MERVVRTLFPRFFLSLLLHFHPISTTPSSALSSLSCTRSAWSPRGHRFHAHALPPSSPCARARPVESTAPLWRASHPRARRRRRPESCMPDCSAGAGLLCRTRTSRVPFAERHRRADSALANSRRDACRMRGPSAYAQIVSARCGGRRFRVRVFVRGRQQHRAVAFVSPSSAAVDSRSPPCGAW
jgi:hypothetical protein